MKIRDLFKDDAGTNAQPPSLKKQLHVEELESRAVPAAIATIANGALVVNGSVLDDDIAVVREGTGALRVLDSGVEVFRVDGAAVSAVNVVAGAGDDTVFIGADVTQAVNIDGGTGNDRIQAGAGAAILTGGDGNDKLISGRGRNQLFGGNGNDLLRGDLDVDLFDGGAGADQLLRVQPIDFTNVDALDQILGDPGALDTTKPFNSPMVTITAQEVDTLLRRASAATATNDAIIAITDRNGRILGVWVEGGVAPNIQNTPEGLTFAVDGAVAKARTGAFFGNNAAPLTSRTIHNLSLTTMTEREINSNPSITDPNSPFRGPGFVAPVQIGAHFPPNIAQTPQVDLFAIEHTNRDGTFHVGNDRIKGTADDVRLPARFNIDPQFVLPGQELFPPDSYGFASGIMPGAQARGIATLPGGIPIYKNGVLVGGIGVFFPGTTGFASEENSQLSTMHDPSKPDRSFEAEFIAFAAVGGAPGGGFPIGDLGGVALPAGFGLPFGRIDLVGIALDIFGPKGNEGILRLNSLGQAIGQGTAIGRSVPVTAGADGVPGNADDVLTQDGKFAPEGWLVLPHDGVGITKGQVEDIVIRGINQSNRTRAAIRLPLNTTVRMVFAVSDLNGNLVGLYRMPDSTIFSIDVAVAKSRNVNYYANADKLQPQDQVPGVEKGVAFSNRTIRNLAQPRFPSGIDGTPPAPFSILNDGGASSATARQIGSPLAASAFQSVQGFDAFNPGTNFRDPTNILNQNGIVFFPGSAPIYTSTSPTTTVLSGGFGVSGDGVDQDDVVTFAGAFNFQPRSQKKADEAFFQGVRLVYQKFNRNPQGGIDGSNY